jgi:hypothetical protein
LSIESLPSAVFLDYHVWDFVDPFITREPPLA